MTVKHSFCCNFFCRGADISATDSHAYTPLMLAASEGHVDAFRTLLEKGASIDGVDKNGETIVHLAASGNHVDLLRVCS